MSYHTLELIEIKKKSLHHQYEHKRKLGSILLIEASAKIMKIMIIHV